MIPELVLYIIISLFNLVIVHRFVKVLFKEQRVSLITEKFTYVVFYILVTLSDLYIKTLWLSSFVLLAGFVVLTLAYQEEIFTRIRKITTLISYSVIAELLVLFLMRSVMLRASGIIDPIFIASYVANRLVFFCIVLYYEKFTHYKNGEQTPLELWFVIFIIPFGSIILILILYYSNISSSSIYYGTVFVLFLNVFAFYLYDRQNELHKQNLDRELYKTQNAAYLKQMQLMQDSIKSVRSIKHDIKNHMIVISALNKTEKRVELSDYVKDLTKSIEPREFVTTGNNTVNSILNYKIELIEQLGHIVELDLALPLDKEINAFDISTIIGNILDNAVEAVQHLDVSSKIKFSMRYEKGTLIVRCINPFIAGYHKQKRGDTRGLGLNNIQQIVNKYDGIITIDTEGNLFDIIVMLYV